MVFQTFNLEIVVFFRVFTKYMIEILLMTRKELVIYNNVKVLVRLNLWCVRLNHVLAHLAAVNVSKNFRLEKISTYIIVKH